MDYRIGGIFQGYSSGFNHGLQSLPHHITEGSNELIELVVIHYRSVGGILEQVPVRIPARGSHNLNRIYEGEIIPEIAGGLIRGLLAPVLPEIPDIDIGIDVLNGNSGGGKIEGEGFSGLYPVLVLSRKLCKHAE